MHIHMRNECSKTYQSLVGRQEYRDAGIDLTNSKGDEHDDTRRKHARKLVAMVYSSEGVF